MNYGENIYQLRKEADISQEALAAAIGTTRQQVSRWECGSAVPSAKYVYALADYFHCPVSKILGEETPNDEKEWGRVSDLPNQFRDFARLLALISVISFFVMAFSSTFAGVQAKALYVLSREVDENTRIQINIAVTEMKKQISLFGAYGQSIVSGGLFAALLARFFRYKKLLDNKIDVYEMFTSLYHASVFVFASLIAIWVMMTIGTHGS
ncbi:MAG: helix-turn-helix domain-containing protein, partial [Bacilli bacterium]|nr:helix-turn-helix domain-containing protein [Bacilli bacterium]